jgi:hypothetical protein
VIQGADHSGDGDRGVQFKAPHRTIAFDDDGKPCNVSDFDFDAADSALEAAIAEAIQLREKTIRSEIVLGVLRSLTRGRANARAIGCRAHVMLYLAQDETIRGTQRELAQRLHMTPGRISQLLTAEKRDLAALMTKEINVPAVPN